MNLEEQEVVFLNDQQIGKLVGFSAQWVRQQRHCKKHGKPHCFTVDHVMIGAKPRYRAAEVYAWLKSLDTRKPETKNQAAT